MERIDLARRQGLESLTKHTDAVMQGQRIIVTAVHPANDSRKRPVPLGQVPGEDRSIFEIEVLIPVLLPAAGPNGGDHQADTQILSQSGNRVDMRKVSRVGCSQVTAHQEGRLAISISLVIAMRQQLDLNGRKPHLLAIGQIDPRFFFRELPEQFPAGIGVIQKRCPIPINEIASVLTDPDREDRLL